MQTNDLTFSTRNTKKSKKIAISLAAIFLLLCLVVPLLASCGSNDAETCYQNALKLIEKKEYTKAYELLWSIKDYEKAKVELEKFKFVVTEIKSSDPVLTKFTYNQNGQPTRIDYTYQFEVNGSARTAKLYHEYTYDDAGLLTRDKKTSDDYIMWDEYYIYDENGLLIEERGTSSTEVTITKYEYDEKGNKIKEITGNSTTVYEYDEKGRMISVIDDSYSITRAYDENGYMTKRYIKKLETYIYQGDYVNTYDEKNRLIKKEETNGNFVETFAYDENGNVVKYEQLENGEVRYSETTSYDEYGNVMTMIIMYETSEASETSETYKYEYTLLYPVEPGKEIPESAELYMSDISLPY